MPSKKELQKRLLDVKLSHFDTITEFSEKANKLNFFFTAKNFSVFTDEMILIYLQDCEQKGYSVNSLAMTNEIKVKINKVLFADVDIRSNYLELKKKRIDGINGKEWSRYE